MSDPKNKETDLQEPSADLIKLAGIDEVRGLRKTSPGLLPGYVLFTPLISDTSYLINRKGKVVHTWKGRYGPSSSYLLDDGHLLRGARMPNSKRFCGGGQGGRIEKFNWAGEVVWSFEQADDVMLMHHDFELMPNGNILAIAWEAKTPDDAIAAGRKEHNTPAAGIWPDMILEIEPQTNDGKVVWQWHSWDHMIQNHAQNAANFGEPEHFPHKIDINAGPELDTPITAEALAQMIKEQSEPPEATLENRGSDMHHSNAISYNARLDQIAISVRSLSEIWIIDHALSTEEAAGPAGDLLYRWGKPSNYGASMKDTVGLGHQHDIRWIEEGYPGAGHLMAFSNDQIGAKPSQSQVVEFEPAQDEDGSYQFSDGGCFTPDKPTWTYSDPGFYAPFVSGARRLSNGNTLVTFGPQGRFAEVRSNGEIVWEYWSHYSGELRLPDGSPPQPPGPFRYAAFRATFIPAEHPGLKGQTLEAMDPQPAPSVLKEEELAPFRV